MPSRLRLQCSALGDKSAHLLKHRWPSADRLARTMIMVPFGMRVPLTSKSSLASRGTAGKGGNRRSASCDSVMYVDPSQTRLQLAQLPPATSSIYMNARQNVKQAQYLLHCFNSN